MSQRGYELENLRYLLWREKTDRARWPAVAASWLACGESRAVEILLGSAPTHAELTQLARATGRELEELQFSRLATQERQETVVQENLRYLFTARGIVKQAIARQIGVHRTTVSDWLSGKAQPTPANIERLAEIFALPPDTNLAEEPIFLSWLPVSDVERRRWLTERIGHLRPQTLRALFPALERLLRDP